MCWTARWICEIACFMSLYLSLFGKKRKIFQHTLIYTYIHTYIQCMIVCMCAHMCVCVWAHVCLRTLFTLHKFVYSKIDWGLAHVVFTIRHWHSRNWKFKTAVKKNIYVCNGVSIYPSLESWQIANFEWRGQGSQGKIAARSSISVECFSG